MPIAVNPQSVAALVRTRDECHPLVPLLRKAVFERLDNGYISDETRAAIRVHLGDADIERAIALVSP